MTKSLLDEVGVCGAPPFQNVTPKVKNDLDTYSRFSRLNHRFSPKTLLSNSLYTVNGCQCQIWPVKQCQCWNFLSETSPYNIYIIPIQCWVFVAVYTTVPLLFWAALIWGGMGTHAGALLLCNWKPTIELVCLKRRCWWFIATGGTVVSFFSY